MSDAAFYFILGALLMALVLFVVGLIGLTSHIEMSEAEEYESEEEYQDSTGMFDFKRYNAERLRREFDANSE